MNDVTETELATFVGQHANYYLRAWRPLRSDEAQRGEFNASAFLLSGGWLLYRRLYRAAAILMATVIVESTVSDALFLRAGLREPPRSYTLLMTLIYTSVIGLFANRWYYHHSVRQITALKAAGMASDQVLARRGGTSWLSVILGLLTFMLLLVLLGEALG
jgi:hypothetical protein